MKTLTEAQREYVGVRRACLSLLADRGYLRSPSEFNTAAALRTPATDWEWVVAADAVYQSVVAAFTDEIPPASLAQRLNIIFEP